MYKAISWHQPQTKWFRNHKINPRVQSSPYIGRFAPSPTGLLHMGSLLTAMASYCQAKKNHGQWLVRVEDLDPPREIAGASENIIATLVKLGFHFSPEVIYQSDQHRQNAYQVALNKLIEQSAVYYCSCSRTELKNHTIKTHTCRNQIKPPKKPYSIKLKIPNKTIEFIDKIQGHYTKNLQNDCGDFILKRKDGLFSYQIAVVVDDAYQNITDIVRGIDLIESTPWQIYLNSLLNLTQACYAHIPILVNHQGQKLSKQTCAQEIDTKNPIQALLNAYNYLNQKPIPTPPKTVNEFWQLAIDNWNINKIAKVNYIKL